MKSVWLGIIAVFLFSTFAFADRSTQVTVDLNDLDSNTETGSQCN